MNETTAQPLVIKGTIDYTITLTEYEYTLDVGKRSIENDLCAILYAKDITEMIQKDLEIMKDEPRIKGPQKADIKSRFKKFGRSAESLTVIASDIIMTILVRLSNNK